MIDRLEHPLPFVAVMRGNFVGEGERWAEALRLADALAGALGDGSRWRVEEWVRSVEGDPERLGSAFYVVYRFAVDYLECNRLP